MKRNEVEKKFTWAIEDLYSTDEKWKEEEKAISDITEKLVSYRGKLGESGENLYNYCKLSEEFATKMRSYYCYSFLKNDEDKGNSTYQGFLGKATTLLTEVSSKLAFEDPEIIAIPDDVLKKFFKETKGLEHYRRVVERKRAFKDHSLSEKEEALLAATGEMASTADNVYSTFVNADLKFPPVIDKDGKELPVTAATFISLMQSPDVNIRRQAFDSCYNTYSAYKSTIAGLFDAQVKQQNFYSKARKFGSNMERALFATEVPVDVYKNLISTVNKRLGSLHKYVKLRKKIMGVDELHMYDLYTSLVPEADVKITFEEAKAKILCALKPMGEEYLSYIKKGFENRWIDIYPNEGKRSGAYSCGTPVHPFVLLNHNDNLDSAFTVIHEMGHAIHSYLSTKNQSPAYDDYVIFVAEVASTFNEALLMKYMLSETKDKKQRAYLINYFLEQFRTTLYRQTMFAEFEMMMNEKGESGETLTAETLCKMYYDLNKKYYGDDMTVDEGISYEWERIPHFFMNFYVYQYATGFSAAMALSDKVSGGGEKERNDYIGFLCSGCKTDPISILKGAGVDMASPEPVEKALDIFDKLIDEMEELLK